MSRADDFDATLASDGQSTAANNRADDFDTTPVSSAKGSSASNTSALGSDYENFMAGAGKAVVDLGRGAKQLIDIPAQFLEKRFPGLSKWSQAQGMPSAAESAQATNADVAESRKLDEPLMNTGAGFAGNVAGNIASTLVPLGVAANLPVRGSGLAAAAMNPRTYTAAAGTGAAIGALQPTTGNESKVTNTVLGGATGIAGNAAVNTIGRIAQPVANALSNAHQKAVDILEGAGIPLDAAQKSGSAFLSKIRSSFWDNPFTAGAQSELSGVQKAGYNRAVLSTIGENADKATPEVMGAAQSRINGVFEDVLSRNKIELTDPIVSKIGNIQAAASEEEKKPIVAMANRIINAVGDDGLIDGQVAYGIKKDLDRYASSSDTTLAYHARQLRSTLMDAIGSSLPTEDSQAFNQARTQFAKMKTIESTIDRTGNGDISPSKLANVMSQKANRQFSVYGKGDQDLVDLAHAGNMLLPDKAPNSGTMARAAMQLAAPLAIGGAEGAYSGDWWGAAKTAAAVAAIPKAAQFAINNPTSSQYLSRGMTGGMTTLRNILESPQKNAVIGGSLRRLPEAFYSEKK